MADVTVGKAYAEHLGADSEVSSTPTNHIRLWKQIEELIGERAAHLVRKEFLYHNCDPLDIDEDEVKYIVDLATPVAYSEWADKIYSLAKEKLDPMRGPDMFIRDLHTDDLCVHSLGKVK